MMLHYNQSSIGSSEKKMQWCIKVSQEARGSDVTATKRLLKLKVQCNPALDLIRLSIGDPTVYGNFTPPSSAVEAVQRQLGEESQSHGKGPPCGEEHTSPHTIATYSICAIVVVIIAPCRRTCVVILSINAGLLSARKAVADLYSALGEEVAPEVGGLFGHWAHSLKVP